MLVQGVLLPGSQRMQWNCLLHTRSRAFLIDFAQKKTRRIPSPSSSEDNSRRKLPDSSATSRFIAFHKLLQYIILLSKMQGFFENFSNKKSKFFAAAYGYFQGQCHMFYLHSHPRFVFWCKTDGNRRLARPAANWPLRTAGSREPRTSTGKQRKREKQWLCRENRPNIRRKFSPVKPWLPFCMLKGYN